MAKKKAAAKKKIARPTIPKETSFMYTVVVHRLDEDAEGDDTSVEYVWAPHMNQARYQARLQRWKREDEGSDPGLAICDIERFAALAVFNGHQPEADR